MADKEPQELSDDSGKKALYDRAAFEQSNREAAKRAHAEKAGKETELRLAAKEAKKEAKKQRRASSVETAEDLAETKERKEFFRKMHKVGKYEFDGKDKLPDLKNKRRVILEGSTDANWFNLEKKRDAGWYQKIAEDAVRIKNLRGYIKTNLDTQSQGRMDKLIDWVVDINNSSEKGRFEHENWHTNLTGAGFTQEEIFGEHGLYNYVLAFRRAASEYEGGKTVRRKLEEKDFKFNKDGSARFDSVKLNLGRTKKGPKHRTTVIDGYQVDKAGGRQKLMEDMIIRLWDKVEAAKMTIDFYGDNQIYIRKAGLTLSVVIITIKGNSKKPGTYLYVINGKEMENPAHAEEETYRLIGGFLAKEKAEKQTLDKAGQTKKLEEKIEKAKKFMKSEELKSELLKAGFQITGVESGSVKHADQYGEIVVECDFKIQKKDEEYLIRIDPQTGKIRIKTIIVAVLNETKKDKYKKTSETGIFTLYEGDISDPKQFISEINKLGSKAKERERKILERLQAAPNTKTA